eukprot:TRINITY_DN397_c0_g2_i1.p1 TRINITY_DN397_c0_g2~~TRINITY_DN397_c0_g2_i1.p1  ORF type:complete len:518 (-),score=103.63 TRINITY_DN397_c0_g2_i1:55-1608(-)
MGVKQSKGPIYTKDDITNIWIEKTGLDIASGRLYNYDTVYEGDPDFVNYLRGQGKSQFSLYEILTAFDNYQNGSVLSSVNQLGEEPNIVMKRNFGTNQLWFGGEEGGTYIDCGRFQGCCDQFSKGLTVEAWVFGKVNQNAIQGIIVNHGGATTTVSENGFSMQISADNKFQVTLQNKKTNTKVIVDNRLKVSNLNDWIHLAFTWDRETVRAYVNFEECSKKGIFTGDLCLEGAPNICIGKNINGESPFSGFIKDVRIWGTSLTHDELKTKVIDDPQRSMNSLIAHWPLDEGSGDVANCMEGSESKYLNGRILGNYEWKNVVEIVMDGVVIPPSPKIVEWEGRKCCFSNVKLNDKSTTGISVFPDTQLELKFDYHAYWDHNQKDYCPGCVVQFYYGIGSLWSNGFVEHGISSHKGSQHKLFKAPSIPGVYYITFALSLHYYYIPTTHKNYHTDAFAVIKVIPKEWSPANHKYFPSDVRNVIKTVLLISQKRENDDPYHPECDMWKIPEEILYKIFRYL